METPLAVGATPLGAIEPLIYVAAAAFAVLVALVTGLPAARRAASIEPMIAMRSE
jgi:ABC-type antimicrobial peptide transport system permease subunit